MRVKFLAKYGEPNVLSTVSPEPRTLNVTEYISLPPVEIIIDVDYGVSVSVCS